MMGLQSEREGIERIPQTGQYRDTGKEASHKGLKEGDVVGGMYRLAAAIYDAIVKAVFLPVGGEKAWRRALMGLVLPGAEESILELCCGTGTLTLMLSENTGDGVNVHGIDLSPEQIKVAQRKARRRGLSTRLSVRDASSTGYPGASFDKIVISGALTEIKKAKRMEICEEARRCLRPTGRLYVSEVERPTNGWGAFCFRVFAKVVSTAPEIVSGSLEREIEEAGFELQEKRHSNKGIIQHLKFQVSR